MSNRCHCRRFFIRRVGRSSFLETAKPGVGVGILTTPGMGKKAAPVVQQLIVIKAQYGVPFGRALERSCAPAMSKPTAAKRPAVSRAQPTAAKLPAASLAKPTVVVLESSSLVSKVTEEEELEIGEGMETAEEQGRRMERNVITEIWASGLPSRMRNGSNRRRMPGLGIVSFLRSRSC